MDKKKTVQETALEILTISVHLLDELKNTNRNKYLEYAPGVCKMCTEYSRIYE